MASVAQAVSRNIAQAALPTRNTRRQANPGFRATSRSGAAVGILITYRHLLVSVEYDSSSVAILSREQLSFGRALCCISSRDQSRQSPSSDEQASHALRRAWIQ